MTQVAVGSTTPGGESTGAQVRAAMMGTAVDGLEVVRQARRVRDDDTDELALLCVRGGSWWVARRLSDQLAVWAFAGDDEAWDGFDRLAEGAAWHEAVADTTEALAS